MGKTYRDKGGKTGRDKKIKSLSKKNTSGKIDRKKRSQWDETNEGE
jgi:hypothetical protein